MKLEAAIKIGEEEPEERLTSVRWERTKANKLLVEAGKCEKANRDNPDFVIVGKLLGETKE